MRRFGWILAAAALAVGCGDDTGNNDSTNNATTNNATTNNATTNNATSNNATSNNATTNNATTNNATTNNTTNNTTVDPLSAVRPGEGAVVAIDSGTVTLSWEGGAAPFVVEFGPDENSLTQVANVMLRSTMIDVAENGIESDQTFVWRVTSQAATADEEVSAAWSFSTVSLELDPCAGDPTVDIESDSFGTVAVGTTCWLDGNLTYGNPLVDNSVDDQRTDKLCPRDGCDVNAYYTGWEVYQWYEPRVENLAGRMTEVCPDGWELPTEAQVTELEQTLTGEQLAGFFPLDAPRTPNLEDLGECIVEGEFEFCTAFIGPESSENVAALWMAGDADSNGLPYFSVTVDGGSGAVDTGVQGASHALSVRCVQPIL